MPRMTRKVFVDLAIWMVGFGLFIGLVFPFAIVPLGVPSVVSLTASFAAACLVAGFAVGIVNWGLARAVIGVRLRLLAAQMQKVAATVERAAWSGDWTECDPDSCRIDVDSDDEIGAASGSFNGLIDALNRSLHVEQAVREFGTMLATHLELDRLAKAAVEDICRRSDARSGAIVVELDGEPRVLAAYGIETPDQLAGNEHVQAVLRDNVERRLDVPGFVEVDSVLVRFRPREALLFPIAVQNVPLGVLVLGYAEPLSPNGTAFLRLLLVPLALALNNALSHDRLQRLAALDPLTGIYNRRFGMGRLIEEFGRAVRTDTPLGVVMFDIDHFKSVNDVYGHRVGDRVLTAVAKAAKQVLREGDVLTRYGGEEFLVVLPGASADDSAAVAERIRRIVSETKVGADGRTLSVTVSVGVTSHPRDHVDHPEELVEHADAALYRAKAAGRDRVVAYG
jgi:two-component system cell cycle response regulator